ncbi:MAG: NAD(P)-dependent oxidoreductase [Hyphomicrobiaceae bacterium]|nr:NAD(P)-dependent oxidoreductase [Hyphomicrobiaceae bacterium]
MPLAVEAIARHNTGATQQRTKGQVMAERQQIGLVGVGNMGAPMARCLARAGNPVMLYDTRPEVTAPLLAETNLFSAAADLTALGRACRTVVTMLPDSKIVRRAAFGDDGKGGFGPSLANGSIVVDMSSSYPLDTVKLGAELAALGVALVDAPVSGGVPRAVSGTLAIMAGGDSAHIDRIEPLLKAMGTVHRTGRLGSGHAMKALNNYVSAAGLVATSEALVVGRQFGLDPAQMVEILNASSGRNNTTENKAQRYMLSGTFDSGFALALMDKDVGMARRLAAEIGVPAAELDFVAAHLTKALAELGPGADHTAVYAWIEGHAAGRG